MNGCTEGLLCLRDRAAEGYEGGTLRDAGDGEALAGEPGGDVRQIAAAEAEARAELLGRKPLVIAGRAGIELGGQELVEGRLLGRRHAEAHRERFELKVGRREAEVGGVPRVTTDGSRQGDPAAIVDGAGDAVLHGGLSGLSGWGKRGNEEGCGECKRRDKTAAHG